MIEQRTKPPQRPPPGDAGGGGVERQSRGHVPPRQAVEVAELDQPAVPAAQRGQRGGDLSPQLARLRRVDSLRHGRDALAPAPAVLAAAPVGGAVAGRLQQPRPQAAAEAGGPRRGSEAAEQDEERRLGHVLGRRGVAGRPQRRRPDGGRVTRDQAGEGVLVARPAVAAQERRVGGDRDGRGVRHRIRMFAGPAGATGKSDRRQVRPGGAGRGRRLPAASRGIVRPTSRLMPRRRRRGASPANLPRLARPRR